jgi:hypothetical protein
MFDSWAMMLSVWYFAFWCIMRGANFTRPSALHRVYVHIWLFVLAWAVLVVVAVSEDRMQLASGYVFVFWGSQVFLATWLSLLDLFSLPRKKKYAEKVQEDREINEGLRQMPDNDAAIAPTPSEMDGETAVHDDDSVENLAPNESTPLIGGNPRRTFTNGYRRSIAAIVRSASNHAIRRAGKKPYQDEQDWSGSMVSSTWFLQFLILGPFMIILTAQLALLLTSSLHQTGPDGSDLLRPYLVIAAFTTLLLLPITPYIHRVSHHIPLVFLAVFAGTLAYCLLAFPFSPANPYKIYFHQEIDLDSGTSNVVYTGFEEFARRVIADMPSSSGHYVNCTPTTTARLDGLVDCKYDAVNVPANPGGIARDGIPPRKSYAQLLNVTATRSKKASKATLKINAFESRNCIVRFDKGLTELRVRGSPGWEEKLNYGKGEIKELHLWRRDWKAPWEVDVEWEDDGGGLDGEVACQWNDANARELVPALDEAWRLAPSWVIVSIKSRPGLIVGSKRFLI